jgi:hypothetical protein
MICFSPVLVITTSLSFCWLVEEIAEEDGTKKKKSQRTSGLKRQGEMEVS